MTAHGYVPDDLKTIPFTVEQARACGLTHKQLQSASWRRISRGWYRWAGCAMSDDLRLAAVLRMVPPGSAFAGRTAVRLLGIEAPAPGRPEILVPRPAGVSERVEALVRRARLAPEEIVQCGPFPVTSPLRTCFDLTGTLPLVEGVVTLDQTLHAGYFGLADFTSYVSSRDFVAGVVGARRAIEYAEPKAESPMETRLRMLLVGGGPPRPEAQVPIFDGGRFVARLDCFFASASLHPRGWASSTTARTTATGTRKTTAGRTVSCAPASTCFATPGPTSASALNRSSPKSEARSGGPAKRAIGAPTGPFER